MLCDVGAEENEYKRGGEEYVPGLALDRFAYRPDEKDTAYSDLQKWKIDNSERASDRVRDHEKGGENQDDTPEYAVCSE